MSFFRTFLYDLSMRNAEAACLKSWRQSLLGDQVGKILEVGAGTGSSIDCYPPHTLVSVLLAEPDRHMHRRLVKKSNGSTRFTIAKMPAELIDFPDDYFDCVASFLVLCTVEAPEIALREIHRVLRPGGRLLFIEHVAAPAGTKRELWQKRLRGLWKRVAGGCDVSRDTEKAIAGAGFQFEAIYRDDMRGVLPILRQAIRGSAIKK